MRHLLGLLIGLVVAATASADPRLVGLWMDAIEGEQIRLNADGTILNSAGLGRWQVQGNQFFHQLPTGQVRVWTFQLQGDRMVAHTPEFGNHIFVRQSPAMAMPPAPQPAFPPAPSFPPTQRVPQTAAYPATGSPPGFQPAPPPRRKKRKRRKKKRRRRPKPVEIVDGIWKAPDGSLAFRVPEGWGVHYDERTSRDVTFELPREKGEQSFASITRGKLGKRDRRERLRRVASVKLKQFHKSFPHLKRGKLRRLDLGEDRKAVQAEYSGENPQTHDPVKVYVAFVRGGQEYALAWALGNPGGGFEKRRDEVRELLPSLELTP